MAATKASNGTQSNPFIKQLASSNRTTRDRALSSLRTYLSTPRSTPLAPLDLLKLWKGLFYCMFMSDKPRNQQNLARDLADLVDALPSSSEKLDFISAFWQTMAKEWANIDYLRLDKYLYLVRCYVAKGFTVLQESEWEEEVVDGYLGLLREEGGPLSPRDPKVPGGLRLHVLDIWVDELEKADGEEKEAPVEKMMAVIRKLAKESLVKSVRVRANEALEDERFVDGKAWRGEDDAHYGAEDDEEETKTDDDEEFGGFD